MEGGDAMSELLLSISDIQRILKIGKNKAYELLKTNTIRSFKIGREWKVTKEALDGYIESLNKKD